MLPTELPTVCSKSKVVIFRQCLILILLPNLTNYFRWLYLFIYPESASLLMLKWLKNENMLSSWMGKAKRDDDMVWYYQVGKTYLTLSFKLIFFSVWTTTKNVHPAARKQELVKYFFFFFSFYILEIFKMVRWYVHCEATVSCLENHFTFHQPAGDTRWKISLSIKQMLSYFPMGNHNISW